MAEALGGASDLLVVGVPTFGWAEGRYFLVKSGSGAEIARYVKERPEDAEDVMLVLRYRKSALPTFSSVSATWFIKISPSR